MHLIILSPLKIIYQRVYRIVSGVRSSTPIPVLHLLSNSLPWKIQLIAKSAKYFSTIIRRPINTAIFDIIRGPITPDSPFSFAFSSAKCLATPDYFIFSAYASNLLYLLHHLYLL